VSLAQVIESNGRFYITPLRVGLNGVSYENKDGAQYICDAVNNAYKIGRIYLQSECRELFSLMTGRDMDDS
jgi:hypothetical protein